VGVGIVFAGAVVVVTGDRFVRGEFFEPDFIIVQEAVLGVIDKDGGGAMRCLFATCKSRLYVAPIPITGLQTSLVLKLRRPSEIISASADWSVISSKSHWRNGLASTWKPSKIGNEASSSP
jgi:hypothetical protein